jgi:hypothetical protein
LFSVEDTKETREGSVQLASCRREVLSAIGTGVFQTIQMKTNLRSQFCVLGIARSSRGFGFAVMAPDGILLDWGVNSVKNSGKRERSSEQAAELISRYRPDAIAYGKPKRVATRFGVQEFIRK